MPTLARCAASLALLLPAGLATALIGCDADRGGVVEQEKTAAEIKAEADAYGAQTMAAEQEAAGR